MQRRIRFMLAGGAALAAAGAAMLVPGQFALSADHLDPPTRTDPAVDTTRADTAADIADVYAFYDPTYAYFAVSFAGPQPASDAGFPAGSRGYYDRDVLYTLNISNSPPATSSDISIRWRFGQGTNGTGSGISVENVPGASGPIVGRVEEILRSSNGTNDVLVYAGLRDDPFFFDLQGFRETLAMATLRFDRTRNFFRDKNDTIVIIGIPRARLGAGPFDVHATTARFGGQI